MCHSEKFSETLNEIIYLLVGFVKWKKGKTLQWTFQKLLQEPVYFRNNNELYLLQQHPIDT